MVRFGLLLLFACALLTGCEHERIVTDRHHPEVRLSPSGTITWRNEIVTPKELVRRLRKAGYTQDDSVNVLMSDDMVNWKRPYDLLHFLRANGFPRTMMVTKRLSSASAAPRGDPAAERAARRGQGAR